jgi:hypothetical protein
VLSLQTHTLPGLPKPAFFESDRMMESDDGYQKIKWWAHECDAALHQMLPLHARLRDLSGPPRHIGAVGALSSACCMSTESALYLVQGQRLWDAETVVRSVMEGTLKFVYLLESPQTFTVRCIEYSDALPAIAALKWHAKALAALNCNDKPDAEKYRPFRELLLSDEEAERIKAAYPRRIRMQIEERWGFTSLLNSLSKLNGGLGPAGNGLMHSYSTASHLQHMSYEGTQMPHERDFREERRRIAIHSAHAARLVSDCFWFAVLRVGAIHRFFNDKKVVPGIVTRNEKWVRELSEAQKSWHEVEYGASVVSAA